MPDIGSYKHHQKKEGLDKFLPSQLTLEKDAIVAEGLRNKLKTLQSMRDGYEQEKETSVLNDPQVQETRRLIDANNIQILKLLNANEMLNESANNHIKSLEDQYMVDNPPPVDHNAMQAIEHKIRVLEGNNWTWSNSEMDANVAKYTRRGAVITSTR